MSESRDIEGRADLEVIVIYFYSQVREDELLGPVFDEIAKVDWGTHIPKIVDFWERAMFRGGNYRGNPLKPHLQLSLKTEMSSERFQRCLKLFAQSVDLHFTGENAEHLKRIAEDIAAVMLSRVKDFAETNERSGR
ncbi:MAG: group III truncated hemoglobin [Verrucomicrobiales bacterium]|nr:group III truncated hemoglobin [Verrucomicrobiales bacterium]